MALQSSGVLEVAGDNDWFKATLTAGQSYALVITSPNANVAARLTSYPGHDWNGESDYGYGFDLIYYSAYASASPNFSQNGHFTASSSGAYYFSVSAYYGAGGNYTLSLVPVIDDYADDTSSTGVFTAAAGGGWNATGVGEFAQDSDYFAATLVGGKTYKVSSSNELVYTTVGSEQYIEQGGSLDSSAYFTPLTSGTYYFGAYNTTQSAQSYTLHLEEMTYVDDYAATTATTGLVTLTAQGGGLVSGTVTGNHEIPNEQDWFKITLQADTLYSFSGAYTSTSPTATLTMNIRDASGQAVNYYGGGGYGGNDFGSFMTDVGGTYYLNLQAMDRQFGTIEESRPGAYSFTVKSIADDFTNNLHRTGAITVGGSTNAIFNASEDEDWFTTTLVAGKSYRVAFANPNTANQYGDVTFFDPTATAEDEASYYGPTLTATTSGTHYIATYGVFDASVNSTRAYTLNLVEYADDFADNVSTSGTVAAGGTVTGKIEVVDDVDWFRVALTAGTSYSADISSDNYAYVAAIYGSDGKALFLPSGSTFTARTTGNYYVAVSGSSANGNYTLGIHSYADDYADYEGTTGVLANIPSVINGTSGPDTLNGTIDADTINGGDGNDVIDGGAGNDKLDGGAGDDRIVYDPEDSAAFILGGTGNDTLVIHEIAAPTGFNLIAQGFEAAERTVTDFTEANSWDSIVDLYNTSWQIVQRTIHNDDGSRNLIQLDPGNTAPTTQVWNNYDAQNRLSSIDQFFDDGTRTFINYDETNSVPFAQDWFNYDAQGRLSSEDLIYDNGTRTFINLDEDGSKNWAQDWFSYDAQGRLSSEDVIYDNGTRTFINIDEDGTKSWIQDWFTYDAQGRADSEDVFYDNGTRTFINLDQDNSQVWTQAWFTYDALGRLDTQDVFNDDGTRIFYNYDQAGTEVFSSTAFLYNSGGVAYQQIIAYDDGHVAYINL